MFPVELIPELREQIVSYLGVWQFIFLSLTCRQALQDVEAYSRRELDRIEREHNVDDTWRFRVGMQAAQDAFTRLSSSEGEQRQDGVMQLVPNNVSHRRMLQSAYRTHLYSLGRTNSREEATSLLALSMHPNGKYLLTGGHGTASDPSVRLWDLTTKRCIKSFIGHGWGTVRNVGFSAGHVVSSSDADGEGRLVRIWSMDGVCKHAVDLFGDIDDPSLSVVALAVSNDSVYAMDTSGPIYVINTMAGTVSSMEEPWGGMMALSVDLLVCKNYLLCVRRDEYCIHQIDDLGVYIFDRDSMDVQSCLPGNYHSIASTSNGDVALGTSHSHIQVYQLQHGSLVPRHALSLPVHGSPVYHIEPQYMTKSSMFVKEDSLTGTRHQTSITVYSSNNGTMERRLCYPRLCTGNPAVGGATGTPWAMTSNEREVFVGFNVGVRHRASGAVKAYLL